MARIAHAAAVIGAAALATIGLGALPATADGPSTFSNTTAMAIPATGSANQIGPASPYPSAVTVSGMTGLVTKVTVTLVGLTHSTANDIDALLVAPTGQNLLVMSDASNANTFTFANNATLTFDDAAASSLPGSGAIPTGTFKPTNNGGGDTFPAPAPPPSAQTTFAGAFAGINPNGGWQLFVVDDATGDIGSMSGGWSLSITTEVAAVATTTSVTSSPNPSATGGGVTFTATVSAGGTPVTAGSVQFTEGGASLGAAVPLSGSGTAALSTSALTEGTHPIVATYSGATGFLTSNGSVSQRVDNATVVTGSTYCNTGALTIPQQGASAPYPSNITVSGAGSTLIGVTATLKSLSHSAPIDLDVMLSGPSGQNVILMSDVGGQSAVSDVNVTLDDAAASGIPASLPSGSFRPTDDDTSGSDSFPAPAPAPSSATTLATFAGTNPNGTWSLWVVDDASADSGSISGGWCLTINTQQATSTALASSANPSSFGQSATFTATVAAGGSPVPAGTVQFTDGATVLASAVPVAADGTATFTTSALAVGSHTITATYSGTAQFAGSGGSVNQVVQLVATSTAVVSSLNPSVSGGGVTFTATVAAGGSPVPAGTVQFTDGATVLASAVPVAADGTATFTTSALAVGSHTITAAYSGTPQFAGSSGNVSQAVETAIVADPGGPYAIGEGDPLTLDGSGTTAGAGAVYEWDVNGDGDYTDATGVAPTLTWAQLEALSIDGPFSATVTLRVTDGTQTATGSTTLDVANTPPASIVTGDLTAVVGTPFTVKVGADDPSSADLAATFSYTVDWGDGSPVETVTGPADPDVTHTYTTAGSFSATFTATDRDGGTGSGTVVQVQVDAAAVPVPTPTPSPTPTGTSLPATGGTDAGSAVALAAGLLVAGMALVMLRRRVPRP